MRGGKASSTESLEAGGRSSVPPSHWEAAARRRLPPAVGRERSARLRQVHHPRGCAQGALHLTMLCCPQAAAVVDPCTPTGYHSAIPTVAGLPRTSTSDAAKRVSFKGNFTGACVASTLPTEVSKWSCLSTAGGTPPLGYPAGRVVTPASPDRPPPRGGSRT
jgi:hypothetical protein